MNLDINKSTFLTLRGIKLGEILYTLESTKVSTISIVLMLNWAVQF